MTVMNICVTLGSCMRVAAVNYERTAGKNAHNTPRWNFVYLSYNISMLRADADCYFPKVRMKCKECRRVYSPSVRLCLQLSI